MILVRFVLTISLINENQMNTNGFYFKSECSPSFNQSETLIRTLGQARESVSILPSGICERYAKSFLASTQASVESCKLREAFITMTIKLNGHNLEYAHWA